MSSKRTSVLALLIPAVLPGFGQDVLRGVVNGRGPEGRAEPLPGASIFWLGSTVGAASNTEGTFEVAAPGEWPASLVTSYVGYQSDTLVLAELPAGPVRIELRASVELRPVEVVERQSSTQLSTRSTINLETLGAKELRRAACCDLSESFETNATVDVSFTDAISGTKAIRMLGLDGRYAQLSVENIPFVRGLSSSYGLTLIPGTWINEINVSKGIGTAVNGPNAMTGQVDLCLLPPPQADRLFLNLYGNSQGRAEINVHSGQKVGEHWNHLLMAQGNFFDQEMDQNGDGFLDQPKTRRINVMDRWMFGKDNRHGQAAVRFVLDERDGGQSADHLAPEHQGHPLYEVNIDNRMLDLFGKRGTIFKNDPTKSIGVMGALRYHAADARFGERVYHGEQRSAYVNAVYQMLLGDGSDQLKAGLSYQFDDYAEVFQDSAFARTEHVPGAFAEYTRHRGDFTMIGGLRVDDHLLYGPVLGPRFHVKYDIGPLTNVRVSAGHAWRTANPLVENSSVLASSRTVITDELGMERAWNVGASFLHKFKWLRRKWMFSADVYRTEFTSQIIADLDRDPQVIAFYMLDGPSFATSVLGDVQVELTRTLTFKVSYRWYDARTTYDGILRERPLVPTHRGMIDLAYADRGDRWRFDITLNLFGPARLPDTGMNPEEFRFPARSPAYGTLHAVITRILGPWEIYLGGENLTDVIQTQQIIAPEDPFGPYFDASLIWGPTNGAMIYGGFRFALRSRTEKEQ